METVGFVFGLVGFIFGIFSYVRISSLEKQLKKTGVLDIGFDSEKSM